MALEQLSHPDPSFTTRSLSFLFCPVRASLGAQTVKNPPAMQEAQVPSLDREDPLEEGMATHTPVSSPGEFQGQRSLVGYNPWGHKEADTTEQLTLHFFQRGEHKSYVSQEHKGPVSAAFIAVTGPPGPGQCLAQSSCSAVTC